MFSLLRSGPAGLENISSRDRRTEVNRKYWEIIGCPKKYSSISEKYSLNLENAQKYTAQLLILFGQRNILWGHLIHSFNGSNYFVYNKHVVTERQTNRERHTEKFHVTSLAFIIRKSSFISQYWVSQKMFLCPYKVLQTYCLGGGGASK